MAECRQMIDKVRDEIRTIETQLADRNKQRNGKRMTGEQYTAWRRNALKAMASKLKQLRELKQWQRSYLDDVQSGVIEVDRNDPDALLLACFMAHEKIKAKVGVDEIDESILTIFDLVRNRVLGLT